MVVRKLINLIGFKVDEKQLSNTEKKVKQLGKNLTSVGKKLSLALTVPLTAFAGLSLRAFNKQAQAVSQVKTGIEATGGAAGRSLEQLQKMARELQENTLFGDEEILAGATAQLLTFTNIAGENFDKTQQVVLDVATRLAAASGGVADLTSTSIMLGKALNDPVANLGALSRSGIQFSKDQKKVIKSLAEGGRLADAQAMILKELEKQYGGSAAAAAKAGTGGLKQLMNLLGDFMEQIGEIIWGFLAPFIEILKKVLKWFIGLSKGTKTVIVIIGALLAILPPLLILIGFLTSSMVTLNAVLIANPIGLIIVGIAALIAIFVLLWFNVERIVGWFKRLWTEGGKIKKLMLSIAAWIFFPITAIIALIFIIKKVIKNFDKIKLVAIAAFRIIGRFLYKLFIKPLVDGFNLLKRIFVDFIWNTLVMGFKFLTGKIKEIIDIIKNKFAPIFDKIGEIFDKVLNFIKGTIGKVIQGLFDMINSIIGKVNFLIKAINFALGKEIELIQKVEMSPEKDTVKQPAGAGNNITVQNEINFNGDPPKNREQIRTAVNSVAGSVFNLQLKKLLIASGGF